MDVAEAFSLGDAIGEPSVVTRGAMGSISRFETSDGVWAIKELFHPPEVGGLESEAAFVDRCRSAGVVVPEIVRSIDGGVAVVIDGRWIRVYRWIDGRPLRSPVDEHVARIAGATLARLHGAGDVTEEPVDDWYTRRCVGQPWPVVAGTLRERGDPLAEDIEDAMEVLVALEALIVEPASERRMCHRDFQPSNVMIDSGDRFVVVDWENAGPLDPMAEIACVVLDWSADAAGRPTDDLASRFFEGYASVTELPLPGGIDVFSVSIAANLNFIAEQLGRIVDGSVDVAELERARAIATYGLADPPSIAEMQRILDVWSRTSS